MRHRDLSDECKSCKYLYCFEVRSPSQLSDFVCDVRRQKAGLAWDRRPRKQNGCQYYASRKD